MIENPKFEKIIYGTNCRICMTKIVKNEKFMNFNGNIICKSCVKKLAVFIGDKRVEVLAL